MVGLGFGRLIGIVVSAVIFASQPSHAGEVLDAMTTPGIGPKPEEITWPPFPEGKRPMEWLKADWWADNTQLTGGADRMRIRESGWVTYNRSVPSEQISLIAETDHFILFVNRMFDIGNYDIDESIYFVSMFFPTFVGNVFQIERSRLFLGPHDSLGEAEKAAMRRKYERLFDGSEEERFQFWKENMEDIVAANSPYGNPGWPEVLRYRGTNWIRIDPEHLEESKGWAGPFTQEPPTEIKR